MQFLRQMCLYRIDAQPRRWYIDDREAIFRCHFIGLPDHGVTDADIQTERVPINLACNLAYNSESLSIVLGRLSLDIRVVAVDLDLELHAIAEICSPRPLQPAQ